MADTPLIPQSSSSPLIKTIDYLQRIALVLFTILPVGLALFSQVVYLYGAWDALQFLQAGLIVAVLLAPVIAILRSDTLWYRIAYHACTPVIWVVMLSVAMRLTVVPLLSSNFISDFEDIHNFAVDVASGNPFANLAAYPNIPWATHLNMVGFVLAFIYRYFGTGPAIAKGLMIFLSAITTWLIYLLGKKLANERVGFVASLLFASSPSLICYSGVLSGEHLALPLTILVILLYVNTNGIGENRVWVYLAGYLLCGIVTGMMDWFRPGGVILLVALVLSDSINLPRSRNLAKRLIALAILIIGYFAVSNMALNISETFFQTDILSTSQKHGLYVLVGLNPETHGQVNLEDMKIGLEAYERFENNNAEANDYLVALAIDRLHGVSLWNLFKSKFAFVWSNHNQLFGLALIGSNDQEFVEVMSAIDGVVYLLITFFACVSMFSYIRNRPSPAIFAMQLFVLGTALGLLILEVQNRYSLIAFPYLIILGSMGMLDTISFFFNRSGNLPS